MKYKVTYRIDSLDTNPDIEYFDDQQEMFDYISEEVGRRVEFALSHSPYSLSDKDVNMVMIGIFNPEKLPNLKKYYK